MVRSLFLLFRELFNNPSLATISYDFEINFKYVSLQYYHSYAGSISMQIFDL